ncbi:MAG TPA: IS256 family transposase [Thermodesulfovibrionales bacterium]|nr:IS256 family transposase [Thermodesulfovibrionales bacterium]
MSVKELTNLKVTDLWKEYNGLGDFWDMQEEAVKDFRRRFIERALEAERDLLIGCRYYERASERKDYRNGYWRRWITVKDGRLEIRMPRMRGLHYESGIIPRYKHRVDEVDSALLKVFLYGASTRLAGEALRPLLGEGVSAQTISNIAGSLDEDLKRYHRRRVQDLYLYLFLDGIILKTRTGFGAKKKAVLVAYGIKVDGRRELIDFTVTNAESEKRWWRFLNDLARRGLRGEALGLVVTDGNPGLENAVDLVWPFVKRQRCWAHKLRNVANYLKRKHVDRCMKEAAAIYKATNRKEAEQAYGKWQKKWTPLAPKAVKCLEKDLEELLNFYSCPKEIWVKVRTTNVIERAFREVRRRTRPMSCFNNVQSIERIVYAKLTHLNEQWGSKPLKEFTHND